MLRVSGTLQTVAWTLPTTISLLARQRLLRSRLKVHPRSYPWGLTLTHMCPLRCPGSIVSTPPPSSQPILNINITRLSVTIHSFWYHLHFHLHPSSSVSPRLIAFIHIIRFNPPNPPRTHHSFILCYIHTPSSYSHMYVCPSTPIKLYTTVLIRYVCLP